MDRSYEPIRRFLQRVRARCRAVSALEAAMRAALAISAVVAVALAGWSLVTLGGRSPAVLASLAGAVLLLVALAVAWGLKPLRGRPPTQLARLVEERVPALDDRLATALDAVAVALKRGGPPPMLLRPRRGCRPACGCDRAGRHRAARTAAARWLQGWRGGRYPRRLAVWLASQRANRSMPLARAVSRADSSGSLARRRASCRGRAHH